MNIMMIETVLDTVLVSGPVRRRTIDNFFSSLFISFFLWLSFSAEWLAGVSRGSGGYHQDRILPGRSRNAVLVPTMQTPQTVVFSVNFSCSYCRLNPFSALFHRFRRSLWYMICSNTGLTVVFAAVVPDVIWLFICCDITCGETSFSRTLWYISQHFQISDRHQIVW